MGALIRQEDKKTILAYLCVCVFWGSTYLAIRIGVSEFPPSLFAGIRFLCAGSIMLGYGKIRKLQFPNNFRDVLRIGTVGAFLLAGCNGFVTRAEQWVHSGITALIMATIPLIMAIIEFLLPSRKNLGIRGWLGLILGFSGVMLLVFSDSTEGAVDIKGALLLLTGTLLWAIGSVYSKSFVPTGDIINQIGIQMLAGGIILSIIGLVSGEASRIMITPKGVGALLYLVVFGSILGYSCYIYILQKWPAAKAGTYAYVNPLVAVFLGSLILDEMLSLQVLISTVVILAGVFMVQTSKVKTQIKIKETIPE